MSHKSNSSFIWATDTAYSNERNQSHSTPEYFRFRDMKSIILSSLLPMEAIFSDEIRRIFRLFQVKICLRRNLHGNYWLCLMKLLTDFHHKNKFSVYLSSAKKYFYAWKNGILCIKLMIHSYSYILFGLLCLFVIIQSEWKFWTNNIFADEWRCQRAIFQLQQTMLNEI